MRKVLFILVPFLLAVVVFALIIFLLANNNQKGALQVTSSPSSKVYLDEKLIGQTPFRTNDLKDMIPAGKHTVKLVSTEGNFEPFEQQITISPKVLTVIDRNFAETGLANASIMSLNPIGEKKEAQISVVTFPQSAQVYLDNNLKGLSPIILKNITQSDHELKITKEGYKDKILRIATVLGYELDALIFIGIDKDEATSSAALKPLPLLEIKKVLILKTPTGFLRVRSDALISALEIGRVSPDETYDLLDEKNGWYKIKLSDDKEGWISSQYALKTDLRSNKIN